MRDERAELITRLLRPAAIEGAQRVLENLREAGRRAAPEVAGFLRRCSAAGVPVYVVSHRTTSAAADPSGPPLRDAAIAWMRAQRLFGEDGLGLSEDGVFFSATRADKLARIAHLGCSHFIDDLEEVFLEPAFPGGTLKILYAPDRNGGVPTVEGIRSVAEIHAVGHRVVHGGERFTHSVLITDEVLDGIEDPQNFGAIVRSAVALGASAVLWAEHASAPLSPATFRASAGAVEHAVLLRVASLPSALQQLAAQGIAAVGLEAHGEVEIAEVDLTAPTALVIGSEGKGLMKSVRRACTRIARLPIRRTSASPRARPVNRRCSAVSM